MPKKLVKIKVTKKHIEKAQALREDKDRSGCCPIAQAFMAQGFKDVSVAETGDILFGIGLKNQGLIFPKNLEKIQEFVKDFDEDNDVLPFTIAYDESRLWTRRTP